MKPTRTRPTRKFFRRRAAARIAGAVWLVLSAAAGCAPSATTVCKDSCDKAQSCGSIDSSKADQCKKACDADSTKIDAEYDACTNKSAILSASEQCLWRGCADYMGCFDSVPQCTQSGSTSSTSSSTGSGTSGSTASGGAHTCYPGASVLCQGPSIPSGYAFGYTCTGNSTPYDSMHCIYSGMPANDETFWCCQVQ